MLLSAACAATARAQSPGATPPDIPSDAELHVVGLSSPKGFSYTLDEVTDWASLAAKLKDAGEKKLQGAALHIWERFSPQSRDILGNPQKASLLGKIGNIGAVDFSAVQRDRRSIRPEFQKLIEDPGFYVPEPFAGYEFNEETKALIQKGNDRSGLDTALLNRLLLRAVFPKEMRAEPVDPNAVEVNVSGGRPMVLVLTAYGSCNWIIRPAKDTKILWVVVSACYPQQVKGVDCTVTTLGKKKSKEGYFHDTVYAHEKDSPEYRKLEPILVKLTGLKIATFQGIAHPDKPFTVRSGQK
jgi:hypothetical protein